MQTHLEFSRGPEAGVRAVIDYDALTIYWEGKNLSRLGSWQRTFSSTEELQSFEQEMSNWLHRNNFLLVESNETNG